MKYIKKIRLSGFGYNINRIVNNYIKVPITRIFSNIKYILTRELIDIDMLDVIDDKVSFIEDKLLYSFKDRLSNLESDIKDKCDEYQVEDVIYNLMGSSEDYVNYDDMNDLKHDIKGIDKKLNTIIDEDLKTIENIIHDIQNIDNVDIMKRDYNVLIDDVIKTIINRLKYIKQ